MCSEDPKLTTLKTTRVFLPFVQNHMEDTELTELKREKALTFSIGKKKSQQRKPTGVLHPDVQLFCGKFHMAFCILIPGFIQASFGAQHYNVRFCVGRPRGYRVWGFLFALANMIIAGEARSGSLKVSKFF